MFLLDRALTRLGYQHQQASGKLGIKGSVKILTQEFLEAHAWEMLKEERPNLCSATLALLIHGIILFLNVERFVDHLTV